MANEIGIYHQVTVTKNGLKYDSQPVNFMQTMAGARRTCNTQDIGTTAEAIQIGADMATLGRAVFTNLDATNFVTIGIMVSATFYPVLRISPGATETVELVSTVTYYAQADTATIKLDYTIFEG